MSLLNNNLKAPETVSAMSADQLRAKLTGLPAALSRLAEAIRGFSVPDGETPAFVTASLFNSDTERRKEALLTLNPAGVVAGLKALTVLTGALGAKIVTPLDGVEDALLSAAEAADLTLCIEKKEDLVKFDHRDDLLVSLDEAAALAAFLCGGEPGLLYAVEEDGLQELKPETNALSFVASKVSAPVKAVLTDHRFYTPAELEAMTLAELGSKSGVLRILTDRDCTVDRCRKELLALRGKSCGRCTFCREGLFQLSAIAEDLSTGRLKANALDLARELCEAMPVSTSCTLGEDASAPMASLMTAFRSELEAHARRKECPAGVCPAFMTFYVDPTKCVGSRDCVKVCPAGAIEAKPGFTSVIESFDCTRCGACLTVCRENAIVKVSGRARIPDKPAKLKNAPAEETAEAAVQEEAPARSGGKRKRSFARPAGAVSAAKPAAPAAPVSAVTAVPAPPAAGAPMPSASAPAPAPAASPVPDQASPEARPGSAPAPTPAGTEPAATGSAPAPAPAAAPTASGPTAPRESSGRRKRVYAKPVVRQD